MGGEGGGGGGGRPSVYIVHCILYSVGYIVPYDVSYAKGCGQGHRGAVGLALWGWWRKHGGQRGRVYRVCMPHTMVVRGRWGYLEMR